MIGSVNNLILSSASNSGYPFSGGKSKAAVEKARKKGAAAAPCLSLAMSLSEKQTESYPGLNLGLDTKNKTLKMV